MTIWDSDPDPLGPVARPYSKWALSLYSKERCDWGYIAIFPLMNAEPLAYGTIPEPWHSNWAVQIVGSPENSGTFLVTGTIAEVKRWVDSLLASDQSMSQRRFSPQRSSSPSCRLITFVGRYENATTCPTISDAR
jgi:hypothetical protein